MRRSGGWRDHLSEICQDPPCVKGDKSLQAAIRDGGGVLVTPPCCCCQSWQHATPGCRVNRFRKRGGPVRDCRCACQQSTSDHSSLWRPGARGSGAAIIRFFPQGGTNAGEADRRMGACIDGEGDLPALREQGSAGLRRVSFLGLGCDAVWSVAFRGDRRAIWLRRKVFPGGEHGRVTCHLASGAGPSGEVPGRA